MRRSTYILTAIIVMVSFAAIGCSHPPDPTVTGNISVESYGVKMSMRSISLIWTDDTGTQYPASIEWLNDSHTYAQYRVRFPREGTYRVQQLIITLAYSGTQIRYTGNASVTVGRWSGANRGFDLTYNP